MEMFSLAAMGVVSALMWAVVIGTAFRRGYTICGLALAGYFLLLSALFAVALQWPDDHGVSYLPLIFATAPWSFILLRPEVTQFVPKGSWSPLSHFLLLVGVSGGAMAMSVLFLVRSLQRRRLKTQE